ncbi:hypothetical protein GCM10009618_04740 [Nesterenkonia lacusekhoensis]
MYRRRRIAVGVLAVLALLGLWWLISSIVGLFTDDEPQDAVLDQQTESGDDADAGSAQSGSAQSGDADSGEQDAQQDSQQDADQDAEQQGPDGSCAPDDVTLTADTGDDSYASDEAPLLIFEVENTGSEGCTLDVGTAQQTFVVASDGREIFNTAQCGAGAQDEEAQDEEAQDEEAQGEEAQDEEAQDGAEAQNNDGASLEMDFEPGQTERAHLTWPRSDSAADCGEPADLEPGTYELTVSLGGITSEPHEFTLAEA